MKYVNHVNRLMPKRITGCNKTNLKLFKNNILHKNILFQTLMGG